MKSARSPALGKYLPRETNTMSMQKPVCKTVPGVLELTLGLLLTGVLPPPSPSPPEDPASSDTNLLPVDFEPRREVLLINASFVKGYAYFY